MERRHDVVEKGIVLLYLHRLGGNWSLVVGYDFSIVAFYRARSLRWCSVGMTLEGQYGSK
jgi:hypothetical protein